MKRKAVYSFETPVNFPGLHGVTFQEIKLFLNKGVYK
jgi:hypothetical protein